MTHHMDLRKFTLTQWSFTKKCRSYELKLLVSKVNLLNSSILASTCLRFHILYNLIHRGRVGKGAFLFLFSLADNPIKMCYDTSFMTSLSMANFGKTRRAFSVLSIHMKVPWGEAYQFFMSINACITACDMQGWSCSNIILYTTVKKWYDICMVTQKKLHWGNNLS